MGDENLQIALGKYTDPDTPGYNYWARYLYSR